MSPASLSLIIPPRFLRCQAPYTPQPLVPLGENTFSSPPYLPQSPAASPPAPRVLYTSAWQPGPRTRRRRRLPRPLRAAREEPFDAGEKTDWPSPPPAAIRAAGPSRRNPRLRKGAGAWETVLEPVPTIP